MTESPQDPPNKNNLAPLFAKLPSVAVSEEEDSDLDAVSESDCSVFTVDSEDNQDDESYIRHRQEKSELIVTDFLEQVEKNQFADFPWPPPPKCLTYKLHMTRPYTKEFWFENESHIGEDYDTARKYLHQVRTSWGYDVDCIPPKWFHPRNFFPMNMNDERYWRIYGEHVTKFANYAINKINFHSQGNGKTYELLRIEKAVETPTTMILLTLTIKERSSDAEKAIRVAVSSPPGCGTEILECKLVPSLSSSSS